MARRVHTHSLVAKRVPRKKESHELTRRYVARKVPNDCLKASNGLESNELQHESAKLQGGRRTIKRMQLPSAKESAF